MYILSCDYNIIINTKYVTEYYIYEDDENGCWYLAYIVMGDDSIHLIKKYYSAEKASEGLMKLLNILKDDKEFAIF